MIGPAFSGESPADPVLEEGEIPNISASATNAALAHERLEVLAPASSANDNVQGAGIAGFIARPLKARRRSSSSTTSPSTASRSPTTVQVDAGEGRRASRRNDSIDPDASDYSSTVNKVKAADAGRDLLRRLLRRGRQADQAAA